MSDTSPLHLILFVVGSEPNSILARENVDRLCREDLVDDHQLDVVDIMEDASLALEHGIIVTPSLLALRSGSKVLIAGNLNNRDRVRSALQLPPGESA